METTQVVVTFIGIALLVLIAMFFFGSSKGSAMVAQQYTGSQEQRIVVKGGYNPSVIHLKVGVPAKLIFERHETTSCSDQVVFPDFGIRKNLPAHAETIIELTPTHKGDFEFACGMNMLRGKLIVE